MNFDFEGEGSGDQAGLTNLITSVAGSLRAADPHWQITMDTYASSAGDPGGFYNIPALAPAVDAFFVMDYELNLAGHLVGGVAADQQHVQQPDDAGPVHRRRSRPPRSSSARRSSASTGRPTTGRWGPRPPAAPPTSPTRRPRATGPSTGTRSPTRLDELPGGRPVARVVLRGRERAVRRVAAGVALRRPRRRHLGARHGERRRADDRGARRHLARRAPGHRAAVDLAEPAAMAAPPGAGRPRRRRVGGRGRPRHRPRRRPRTELRHGPGRRAPARKRRRRRAATGAPTTTTTAASITGVYNGATVSLTPVASSSVLGWCARDADRLPVPMWRPTRASTAPRSTSTTT